MESFDETLVDPPERQLVTNIEKAARTANRRLKERRVEHSRSFYENAIKRLRKQPEGVRDYNGGRGGLPAATVRLAWWTDALGRRHWRIVGRRREWADLQRQPDRDLPLGRLYPDHVLLRRCGSSTTLLVVCPECGLCGTPAALAWMGPRCGPCHDRQEEGAPAGEALLSRLETHQDSPGQYGGVAHLRFLTDGKGLISVNARDRARLWDLETGKDRRLYPATQVWRPLMAIAPDGLLARYVNTGRTLRLLRSGEELHKLQLPRGHTFRLAFSPSGRWLATAGSPSYLLNTQDPRPQEVAFSEYSGAVAFRDEQTAVFCTHTEVIVVHVRDGEQERIPLPGVEPGVLEADDELFWDLDLEYHDINLTASPDGRWLVMVSYPPESLLIFDWRTRQWSRLAPSIPLNPDSAVLQFSPEGLLAAGFSNSLSVLDLNTATEVATFFVTPDHDNHLMSLAFSPDGQTLALGHADGRIVFRPWRLLLEG